VLEQLVWKLNLTNIDRAFYPADVVPGVFGGFDSDTGLPAPMTLFNRKRNPLGTILAYSSDG
jgi:hypothetical protein